MPACPIKSVVRFQNYAPSTVSVQERIVRGLRQSARELPSFLLYDVKGIRLFDRLSRVSNYSTASEEADLIARRADELRRLIGRRATIVEYGSGTARTAAALVRAIGPVAAYLPVDLSLASLKFGVRRLRRTVGDAGIMPVRADFHSCFPMPVVRKTGYPLVYLSSCVLSTMDVASATRLLRGAATFCGQRGGVLLGADLRTPLTLSSSAQPEAARQLLEEFNCNVLAHLNRRYAGRFHPARFRHALVSNHALRRTELRLVSSADQVLKIEGERIRIRQGESILTEARRRYRWSEIEELARDAGIAIERIWFDPSRSLALVYLRPAR
ncbi:MAG: L-histidine N(alpha)-methyltransferase [Pirellulales bacterium]